MAQDIERTRRRVASCIASMIQTDIYAGRYSVFGRPNVTSLQHILGAEGEELAHVLDLFREFAATLEGAERERALEALAAPPEQES